MAINRKQYELGLCPSPGRQNGKEYRTPVAISQSYDAETNRITVTIYMLREGMTPPDKIYDLYLCQEGQQCGCRYESTVGWRILESCAAVIDWQWPSDAGCLLKSGYLSGSKTGIIYAQQLYEDPGWQIYPVGDIRNPECPGCGMAGDNAQGVADKPVPGERFTVFACIDEEACLSTWGEGGCHPIGADLFQTVGFMGGQIHDVFDEEARIYEVMVDGVLTGAQGTDLTTYNIGDWVALAKVHTEYPTDDEGERATVTNENVPMVGIEEYMIIPFAFEGEA